MTKMIKCDICGAIITDDANDQWVQYYTLKHHGIVVKFVDEGTVDKDVCCSCVKKLVENSQP